MAELWEKQQEKLRESGVILEGSAEEATLLRWMDAKREEEIARDRGERPKRRRPISIWI